MSLRRPTVAFHLKPFMWCRPDARLRHYYSCSFLSCSHLDPRLAPVLLFLQFPLEESFRPSFGTQYFTLDYFLTTCMHHGFSYISWQTCDHIIIWSMFDIYYTRVLNVCEYIQTYSLACPWLLSWPNFLHGEERCDDSPGTHAKVIAASRR